MPKVAIVCGAGIVSGKEIMALELAKGLRDKGCEVEVVTSSWGNGEFRRRLQDENLPAHIMRLGFISATLNFDCMRMTAHQMLFWPTLLRSYRQVLCKIRPDKIIHTNWHHLLLLWPFLNLKRDLFWVHDIVLPRYRRLFRSFERRLNAFVPVSHAVAKSIEKLGIPKTKIHVIYSGIEDPAQGPATSNGKPRLLAIGIVGQIGPWKGHEDLLAAFSRGVACDPTIELHVFGKGQPEYEKHLNKQAVTLGIENKIIWHGFVADRAKVYQSMDICVVPSRCDEALGMVAIEAAFFGIPVIASRRGGLQEVVEDDVTGLLFPSGEIDKLASALNRLVGDADLRQAMGTKARQRMIAKFSQDGFIGDFFRLLKIA